MWRVSKTFEINQNAGRGGLIAFIARTRPERSTEPELMQGNKGCQIYTHRTLGNLSGNLLGNLSGNLLGNLFGNLSGNLFGNLSGELMRNAKLP